MLSRLTFITHLFVIDVSHPTLNRTKRCLVLLPWIKAALLYHASYIMSNPSMQPVLSSLYQVRGFFHILFNVISLSFVMFVWYQQFWEQKFSMAHLGCLYIHVQLLPCTVTTEFWCCSLYMWEKSPDISETFSNKLFHMCQYVTITIVAKWCYFLPTVEHWISLICNVL